MNADWERDANRQLRKVGIALFFWAQVTGMGALFASGGKEMVNTQVIDGGTVTSLAVSYMSGNVLLRETEGASFTVSETVYNGKFATIEQDGGSLRIEQPLNTLFSFGWHKPNVLTIDIPRSFRGNYELRLASGRLTADTPLASDDTITLHVTSGTMDLLRTVTAPKIGVTVMSGTLRTATLAGDTIVNVASGNLGITELRDGTHRVRITSGTADIQSAEGGGDFESTSGTLKLGISDINRDISVNVTSGTARVTLPLSSSFYLDADTTSGSINITSADDSYNLRDRSSVVRPIGENPQYTIRVRVMSGNIRIERK
jgi:DUF4097 and DUF4098 domain-containing protein YvlB